MISLSAVVSELGAWGSNEHVIAPAEGIASQERGGLVHAVDDAVGGDVLRCPREARERGERTPLVLIPDVDRLPLGVVEVPGEAGVLLDERSW